MIIVMGGCSITVLRGTVVYSSIIEYFIVIGLESSDLTQDASAQNIGMFILYYYHLYIFTTASEWKSE